MAQAFACWITKATKTHSQYVIFPAFPRQRWLHARASILLYIYIYYIYIIYIYYIDIIYIIYILYIYYIYILSFMSRVPLISKFNVYGSVHRKYIPIYIQKDATLHSLFISENCFYMFRLVNMW